MEHTEKFGYIVTPTKYQIGENGASFPADEIVILGPSKIESYDPYTITTRAPILTFHRPPFGPRHFNPIKKFFL
jgi:hypothetical protein